MKKMSSSPDQLTSAEWFGNECALLKRFVHQRRWIEFWWVLHIRWLSSIIGKGMIVLVIVVALRNIAILISISTRTRSARRAWRRSSETIAGWNWSIG